MNNNNIRSSLQFPRRALTCAITMAFFSAHSYAAPTDGQVVGGSGSISQNGLTTVIHQETDRLAIDWQSFNIGTDEHVQFLQPSSQSLALNRVIGNDVSHILGRLDANGHVILVNPHGVVFSQDARVDVGGLVASGLDINPQDFINGGLAFKLTEGTDGTVINRGLIKAASGGNVAMIGKRVINENLISAELGTVTLAAGREAVLTFDPDGLLGVKITKDVQQKELGLDPAVLNSGTINAISGRVLLTANVSSEVFSRTVNAGDLTSKTEVLVYSDGSFTLGRGAKMVNTGDIDVSSVDVLDDTAETVLDAGQVVMLGEDILHTGSVRANVPDAASYRYRQGDPASGEVVMVGASRLRIMGDGVVEALSETGAGGDVTLLGQHIRLHERAAVSAGGGQKLGQITVGGRGGSQPSRLLDTRSVEIGTNAHLVVSGPSKTWTADHKGDIAIWSTQSTVVKGRLELAHYLVNHAAIHIESEGTLGFSGHASLDGVMFRPYPGHLKLRGRDLVVSPKRSNTTINEQSLSSAFHRGAVLLQADNSLTIGDDDHIFKLGIPETAYGNGGATLRLHAGESISLTNTIIQSHLGSIELIAGIPTASPRPLTMEGQYGIFLKNSQLLSDNRLNLHSFAGIHGQNVMLSSYHYPMPSRIAMTAETAIDLTLDRPNHVRGEYNVYNDGSGLFLFVQPNPDDISRPALRAPLTSSSPYIRVKTTIKDEIPDLNISHNLVAVARSREEGDISHIDLSDLIISRNYDRSDWHPQRIHIEADTLAAMPQLGSGFGTTQAINIIAHQGDIIHQSPVYTGGGNYFARAGGNILFSRDSQFDNSVLYLTLWDEPEPGDPSGIANVLSGGNIQLTIGAPEFLINTNGQPANIKIAD